MIWDQVPSGAASNIRTYISHLRKILRHAGVCSETVTSVRGGKGSGGYRLNISPSEIDLFVFHRLLDDGQTALATNEVREAEAKLSAALALWRGPAGGPDVSGAGSLMEWLGAHNRLRVAAQEDLTEVRLQLGRHSVLIPHIRAVLAHHPYRERSWGQLARACYFAGDLVGALDTFGQARAVLVGDLGVEPGPDLQAIHSAILNRAEDALRHLRCSLVSHAHTST
ncbi:hypothetical protein Skr01_21520 [Sphaerisporangium krabiense]|nr:hypothetical protein Skr01_21520 [Sphaerisporangium krabiense]